MKHTKKLVIVILSLVLAFACGALVLTACNTDKDADNATYSVTVEYDRTKGTVTVSEPKNSDKYQKGENVTVMVEPTSGYEVASFTVSGRSDANLTNGKYEFNIESNVKISVTFQKVAPGTRYSITTLFNAQRGSVQVSAPADGGEKYIVGETVTVTVEPFANFMVDSFTVSGHSGAKLTDGEYSFEVTGDTIVSVSFEYLVAPEFTENMLQALQGSITLEGQFVEQDYLENSRYVTDYLTIFDALHNAVWFREWYRGALALSVIYYDIDGKASILMHDEQGKIASEQSETDFSEFGNPFILLTPNDFEYFDEGVWKLSDLKKAATAATALTGYGCENMESFLLYENDGVITGISITLTRVTTPYSDYQQSYAFDVTFAESAVMPDEWFSDYEETAEHAELKQALKKAYEADSYTVHYYSHEEGYSDVEYDIYATPNGIYEDPYDDYYGDGKNGSGYMERRDGGIWWYSYDPITGKFNFDTESLSGVDSIYDIFARFDLEALGISYSMLEYKGNGVFELRFVDQVVDQSYTIFAGAMAVLFGTGYDQRQYFATAIDFSITIRDGELYQVEFTYNYYGYITERVVLTFSDFGETTLPITITDEAYQGTFTDEFIGNWMDEKGVTAVVITLDKLKINGLEITDIEKIRGGYSIVWDDRLYTLSYNREEGVLILTNAYSSQTILYSTNCKWTSYVGVYEVIENGVSYTVLVSENGIVVLIDGKAYVSDTVSFGKSYGYDHFVFTAGGVLFGFDEDEDGLMNLYSEETLGVDVYLSRITSADCAWYEMELTAFLRLLPTDRRLVFLGDGLRVHEAKIRELLPAAVIAPANLRDLRADAACLLAAARRDEWMEPAALTPIYLRKPQAERERAKRLQQENKGN